MAIDWKTLLFELINFAALMYVLGRFLFKPVRKVMLERRDEIERSRREALAARAELDQTKRDFDARRAELEAGVEAIAAEARARGDQLVDDQLAAARVESQKILAAAAAEAEAQRRRVLADLRPQLTRLAADAAGRLLHEIAAPHLTLAFARRAALALRAALPTPHPPIQAWLSADADEAAIHKIFREVFGPAAVIELHKDDALIAGVRLIAGGLEVPGDASAALSTWLEGHESGDLDATSTAERAA
ncbi:MAG: ATP synthase F0 subunit B [Nannocystis sp.]|nr:ATP synthase F0 subunit B [Nannocystis sp.]